MVQWRLCSFCGNPIEPGTGMMFIKKDATVYNFCSSKCRRNLLDLHRVPRKVRWTQHAMRQRGPRKTEPAAAELEGEAPPAPVSKEGAEPPEKKPAARRRRTARKVPKKKAAKESE